MMLKCFAWFIFFLCTTALSCWKLEGFPTLESQDFNLSEPVVVQGQEIHVAGLNRKVGLEAEGDKEEYEKKHEDNILSKTGKRGKGAAGGADVAHRPRQPKNAASSLARPPFFLSTAVLNVSFIVILAFPSLLPKLIVVLCG